MKKIFSILLTLCICLSFATVASAASIGSIETDVDVINGTTAGTVVGSDTAQDKNTVYHTVNIGEEETEIPFGVYASMESFSEVLLPKTIILNGKAGVTHEGKYIVGVRGDLTGEQVVNVVPEDTVELHSAGRLTAVEATITQEKEQFTYADGVRPTDTFEITALGTIVASGLRAGKWNGNFYFNIGFGKNNVVAPEPEEPEEPSNTTKYYIGKTVPEYVVAEFNEDNTEVRIYKNGEDSDGLMKNFKNTSNDVRSPMVLNKATLEKVTIEEGVVSIGTMAFQGCTNITSVSFPETLDFIDSSAFHSCESLKNIVLPSNITKLGNYAFFGCETAGDFSLPSKLEIIGQGALASLTSCENITVDENNPYFNSVDGVVYNEDFTRLVQYASGRKQLSYTILDTTETVGDFSLSNNDFIDEIIFPEGVTDIRYRAVTGCDKLTKINLPSTLKSIGQEAFYALKKLSGVITIPASVTSMGPAPFTACATSFVVESGNTSYKAIEDALYTIDGKKLIAYPAHKDVDTISIPEGVEVIGQTAFHNIMASKIIIPSTILTIEKDAFYYCNGLKELTILSSQTTMPSNCMQYTNNIQTIEGIAGSAVETFAVSKGITFVEI